MNETRHLLQQQQIEQVSKEERELEEFGESQPITSQQTRFGSVAPLERNIRHRTMTNLSMPGGRSSEPHSSESSDYQGIGVEHQPSTSSPRPSTHYGTLQSSAFKRTMFIDSRYPRTYFTGKQFCIAAISMLLFIGAVTITLVFGLPRLQLKREEYFAARYFISNQPEMTNERFTILISDNEHSTCADVARDVMLSNGTVMDGALASLFCLMVASPHLVAMDSGFIGMIYSNSTMFTFQSEEQLIDIGQGYQISAPTLPLSVDILHKQFGQKSWSDLLEPAIHLAQNGVPISHNLAELLRANRQYIQTHLKGMSEQLVRFQNQSEVLLKQGDMYKNGQLSALFKQIAQQAPLAQYFQMIVNDNHFTNQIQLVNQTSHLAIDEETIKKQFHLLLQNIQTQSTKAIKIQTSPLNFSLINSSYRLYSGLEPDSLIMAFTLKLLDKLLDNSGFESCSTNPNRENSSQRSLKENAVQLQYLLDTLQFANLAFHRIHQCDTMVHSSILLDEHYIEQISQHIITAPANRQRDDSFFQLINNVEFCKSSTISNMALSDDQTGNNVQIIIHHILSGDVIALTTTKKRTLFQGDMKIVLNNSGLVLDVFNTNIEQTSSIVQWPLMAHNSEGVCLTLAGVGGRRQMQTLQAMVQVASKFLLNCQPLKSAIDDARIFVNEKDDDEMFYEKRFPQAYIDLLMRLFKRTALKPGYSGSSKWSQSSVYGVMAIKNSLASPLRHETENSIEEEQEHLEQWTLRSMIDFRGHGYIGGQ